MEEYYKNFDAWNEIKIKANRRKTDEILIQEGAVWLMEVGVNVGVEIDGKGEEFVRPVIVVRKINNQMFLGVPVSSKEREDFYRVGFELLGERHVAKIAQMRAYDKKRFVRLMEILPRKEFMKIVKNIVGLFDKFFPKNETPHLCEGDLGCPEGDNG